MIVENCLHLRYIFNVQLLEQDKITPFVPNILKLDIIYIIFIAQLLEHGKSTSFSQNRS